MNRRSWLKSLTWLGLGSIAGSVPARAAEPGKGIVLYCDLQIDPAREKEMLTVFHSQFKPVAQKHKGYVDLKMLKLNRVIQGGPAPARGVNYRFQLTYESEALRQAWVRSEDHEKFWPMVEAFVVDKGYLVLLTDVT